jgi:ferrochelatase
MLVDRSAAFFRKFITDMTKTKGIVLLQFGGPDSLDAVEPFLYNLFKDNDIIQFPGGKLTQKIFAKGISKLRYKKLQTKYAEIGGRSPIVEKTFEQQKALQDFLDAKYGKDFAYVELAMRYWKPFTSKAIRAFQAKGIQNIVLLPLYAQYSVTNAGSSYHEWEKQKKRLKATFNERRIDQYYDHPLYIQAFTERIVQAIAKFRDPSNIHILFSAHGTPVNIVERGDPYSGQIKETVELVMKDLNKAYPFSLSYQSKVGPREWLKPDTESMIKDLAKNGIKKLLVVPISFVSDHIETSHELDIEAREEAEKAGIEEFIVSEGLNNSPLFIEALADLAIKAMEKLK